LDQVRTLGISSAVERIANVQQLRLAMVCYPNHSAPRLGFGALNGYSYRVAYRLCKPSFMAINLLASCQSFQDTGEHMNEFGDDYLHSELSRSICDLHHAHAALMRAQCAATLTDKESRRAWMLVLANTRSALSMASTICVREIETQLNRLERDDFRHFTDAT
jgi:hypothetical protein